MIHIGSKNRISKDIKPFIQEALLKYPDAKYIEPFVGGANMIDKIEHHTRIGYDTNKYLIPLLTYIRDSGETPITISEAEYKAVKSNIDNYPDYYVGLVGFCGAFASNFLGGYAKGKTRDYPAEAIRNIKKQNLSGIDFKCADYMNNDYGSGNVIYCDPPYSGSSVGYCKNFDSEKFYDWCRSVSKNNIVFISEYSMPDDFTCIWSKEITCHLQTTNPQKRVEKLFVNL